MSKENKMAKKKANKPEGRVKRFWRRHKKALIGYAAGVASASLCAAIHGKFAADTKAVVDSVVFDEPESEINAYESTCENDNLDVTDELKSEALE